MSHSVHPTDVNSLKLKLLVNITVIFISNPERRDKTVKNVSFSWLPAVSTVLPACVWH